MKTFYIKASMTDMEKIELEKNAQNLASQAKYDGDAIAQIMFDALTECNFHTEVKILHTVWEAMAIVEATPESLMNAAKKSLGDRHD